MKGFKKVLFRNPFFPYICNLNTEVVAQLVRALDCGSRGRGFETLHPPSDIAPRQLRRGVFYLKNP